MGIQLSRPPTGPTARGILTRSTCAKGGSQQSRLLFPAPSSSSVDEQYYGSTDSVTVGPRERDTASSAGALKAVLLPPIVLDDGSFSAFSCLQPVPITGSLESDVWKDSTRGLYQRRQRVTHSLPDRIDAEDGEGRSSLELASSSIALSQRHPRLAELRRCHTDGSYSLQQNNRVSPKDTPKSSNRNKLDGQARRMFFDFYQRNIKELRRQETVPEATPSISARSAASCPVFASGASFETVQQKSVRGKPHESAGVRLEAEVEAVEALDVFSPDERNTRIDEFLTLVQTIQAEYQVERRRIRAVRGLHRAFTFGVAARAHQR